jgi:hypothetical protein
MRRLTLTLVLFAAVFLIKPAHGSPLPKNVLQILRQTRAALVVPPEWDGEWNTLDTVYTCAGAFQSTSTSEDTICGGKDYAPNGYGSPINFVCTGTATATTINMTCTGSGELFTDCNGDYTIVSHGTLSGSNSHTVTTISVTYSGTACDFLPPSCIQVDSWGTRIGPAPVGYCATPTRLWSWGQVKLLYR